jgi:CHAT domain-containing protein
MWEVSDEYAAKFSKAFYKNLLDGKTVGMAAKDARNEIKSPRNPSWLAYTVFADPEAAVK